MFNLIKSYYGDTDPELVDEMELAIKIINTGVRHTDLEITVVADESGSPLANATVTDNTSGKQFTCDEDGMADLGTHRAGKFKFTVSALGRQTVILSATVVRGTQNQFTVRLIAN